MLESNYGHQHEVREAVRPNSPDEAIAMACDRLAAVLGIERDGRDLDELIDEVASQLERDSTMHRRSTVTVENSVPGSAVAAAMDTSAGERAVLDVLHASQPAPSFPAGALFRLRSGGPAMTVAETGSGGVECCWIGDGGVPFRETYAEAMLVEVAEPAVPPAATEALEDYKATIERLQDDVYRLQRPGQPYPPAGHTHAVEPVQRHCWARPGLTGPWYRYAVLGAESRPTGTVLRLREPHVHRGAPWIAEADAVRWKLEDLPMDALVAEDGVTVWPEGWRRAGDWWTRSSEGHTHTVEPALPPGAVGIHAKAYAGRERRVRVQLEGVRFEDSWNGTVVGSPCAGMLTVRDDTGARHTVGERWVTDLPPTGATR